MVRPKHPKEDLDDTKIRIKSIKKPKDTMCKTLKKHSFFSNFQLKMPLKRAPRNRNKKPNRLGKKTKIPKKGSNIEPKKYVFLKSN